MATVTTFAEYLSSRNIDLSTVTEKDIIRLRGEWKASTGNSVAPEKKPRQASHVRFELRIPTGDDGVYRAFPRTVQMVPGRGAETLKSAAWELLELQALEAGCDVTDAERVYVESAVKAS